MTTHSQFAIRGCRVCCFGALLVAVPLLAGCGGGSESEVSGTVTLDGKPVGPGVVVFAPLDGKTNPADGAIQPNGTYFLKTSRQTGLKAGKYRVSVTVLLQPDVKPGERSMEKAKLVTPQKYADVETSGLEFDVTSGKNAIDIPLSSK